MATTRQAPPGVDFSPGGAVQAPRYIQVNEFELNALRHRLQERAQRIKEFHEARAQSKLNKVNKHLRDERAKLYAHYLDLGKRKAQLKEREEQLKRSAERLKTEAQVVNEFKKRNVSPNKPNPVQPPPLPPNPRPQPSQSQEPPKFSKEWYDKGYQYQYRGNGPQTRTREVKVGPQRRDSKGRFTKKATANQNYEVYGPRGGQSRPDQPRPSNQSGGWAPENVMSYLAGVRERQGYLDCNQAMMYFAARDTLARKHQAAVEQAIQQQRVQAVADAKQAVSRAYKGLTGGIQRVAEGTKDTVRNLGYELQNVWANWQKKRYYAKCARERQRLAIDKTS